MQFQSLIGEKKEKKREAFYVIHFLLQKAFMQTKFVRILWRSLLKLVNTINLGWSSHTKYDFEHWKQQTTIGNFNFCCMYYGQNKIMPWIIRNGTINLTSWPNIIWLERQANKPNQYIYSHLGPKKIKSQACLPEPGASKLLVADMPQLGQKKKKPQGGKVRKSKYSPAGPLHGTKPPKVQEPKIAGARLLHERSKGACYFFNPKELRGAPGAWQKKQRFTLVPTPHQGSYNIFDFVFCKPDCSCSVPDCVFSGLSLPLPNIKDDSSSSDQGWLQFLW